MDIKSFIDKHEIISNILNLAGLGAMFLFAGFYGKIKEWLEKKTNDKFERSINKTSLIRDNLAELRAITGAARVMLFQLHNGQYYFSGEGADKMSLTHFVVDSGVAVPDRAGTRLQNIPVAYWPDAFKEMTASGYFGKDASQFTDPFTAQMFSLDGVDYAVIGPVKDRRGFWRGVLIVCNMDGSKPSHEDCAIYGQKIGDLLSL